jgi:hypothetical protein
MARLNAEQKKAHLTEYLRLISKDETLFIYSVNKGVDIRFAVARELESSAIDTRTAFMNFDQMEYFFKGALAITQGTIKLN